MKSGLHAAARPETRPATVADPRCFQQLCVPRARAARREPVQNEVELREYKYKRTVYLVLREAPRARVRLGVRLLLP